MTVEDSIKAILLDILDVDDSGFGPAKHLRKDLGASSVDMVEILAALESDFDLEISDEDAENLLTVQAIVDYIKEKTA